MGRSAHLGLALAISLLLPLVAACSRVPSPVRAEPATDPDSPEAPGGPGATWTYDVAANPGGAELSIDATFPGGPAASEIELAVGSRCHPYVVDVARLFPDGWKPLERTGDVWKVPEASGTVHVRYRFLLARAASDHDDFRVARATGKAIESPPSTWLLRPSKASPGTRFVFRVTSAPGDSFVTGILPASEGRDACAGLAEDMGMLPFAAFGELRVHEFEDGAVLAAILPGELDAEAELLDWIRDAARAVRGFYGRMPVPRLAVFVRPVRGGAIGFGTTMGGSGAGIAIDVGRRTSRARFREDWILAHEMTHTALPDLGRSHHWLEEGLATYVEPLARARAGLLSKERVWQDWVEGMPKGEPEPGDEGLDRTHTWGRTYWGGALFCLVADLEIRERTGGRKSLRDALLGVQAAGGDISVSWEIDRVIEAGDAATGVPVLRETYDRMKETPVNVDLDSIWRRLGIVHEGGRVAFDDAAPLASVREEMTRSSLGR